MWQAIIASLIVSLLTAIIFKPKTQTQPPAGIDEIQVPTAEDGREIPVAFGCVNAKGANVTWWGDFMTKAIRIKNSKK